MSGDSSGISSVGIISGCAAAAAAVVVALLVVIFIKIRSKKHSSIDQEQDDVEHNDLEGTNTFSMGFSTSNIEEDPFANDFKEGKFIDQN